MTEALLAALLPDLEWPQLPPNLMWSQVRERWPLLRQSCEAAAVRIARSALGLAQLNVARATDDRNDRPTEPFALTLGVPASHTYFLASDQIVPRIAKAFAEIYMIFGEGSREEQPIESQRWAGLLALIAGVFGEWDLVATMTGGALPSAVTGDPVFRDKTMLIARHFAVVARTRKTKHAVAAMEELRQQIQNNANTITTHNGQGQVFTAQTFEVCVALTAARIYFERAAQAPNLVEAIRAWLAGAPLTHEEPIVSIADGGDPRATIFERYLPELSDTREHANARRLLEGDGKSAAVDSAAVLLFVAREPLPEGWASRLDPIVAELLGASVDSFSKQASLADLKMRARNFRAVSNIPLAVPANLAHALIANDEPAILMITGRGTLNAFRPREIFGDDFRLFGRYLLAAKKAKASAAEVAPAWFDFLARRSPRTSRLELTWRDLLLYQRIISVDLGGEPASDTGLALRAAITSRA